MAWLSTLVTWTQTVFTLLGSVGLFFLSVIESIFFPIPPDVLLIILVSAQPEQFLWYAAIATVGSIIGASIGYAIGLLGEKIVLQRLLKPRTLARMHDLLDRYEGRVVFIAALSPIPYKLFAISAGVLYLRFRTFLFASFIARGLRFFLVAFVVSWLARNSYLFSPELVNLLLLVVGLFAIEAYLAFQIWFSRRSGR